LSVPERKIAFQASQDSSQTNRAVKRKLAGFLPHSRIARGDFEQGQRLVRQHPPLRLSREDVIVPRRGERNSIRWRLKVEEKWSGAANNSAAA
jgi:hypothetical protein